MGDIVNPLVELAAHAGDEALDAAALKQLGLVADLKSPPDFKRFPGSTLLRHYRPGDVVCRQGDAGSSAFYILTTEDVVRLRRHQLAAGLPAGETPSATAAPVPPPASTSRARWQRELERFEQRARQLEQGSPEDRAVASARLVFEEQRQAATTSRWGQWWGAGSGASLPANETAPQFIPNDGPADLDYRSRRAPLHEGEVFGEMSCMTLAPRSATVVVERECLMLEFLRNIFDKIQKDAGYRARIDAVYRQRVLAGHLRRLDILREVAAADLEHVGQQCELLVVDPGTVLCDEGDQADAVYLIRSGLVQVLTGTHVRLAVDDVANWPAWCRALQAGATPAKAAPSAAAGHAPAEVPPVSARAAPAATGALPPMPAAKPKKALATPGERVWQSLPEPVRSLIGEVAAAEAPAAPACAAIASAMNDLLRSREFVAAEEFAPVLAALAPVALLPKGAKGAKKEWNELEVRIAGRTLLAELFPEHVRRREFQGPPRVINYLSRGDIFGELGVLLNVPRSATCLAYDHPSGEGRREPGRVELVRIGREVFLQLRERSPAFRAQVDAVVGRRRARDEAAAKQPAWAPSWNLFASPEAQELGLVQGQKLLLIDLDRCTRCGDCVRACINTHDDGYSRLFLEGPRFDRFLIPSACRQCLNPACMMGCPVGSIQRGDNGQIEIRHWCIGCGLCATQCPYESIQMHDVGLLPERDTQWHLATTLEVAGRAWQAHGKRPLARAWAPCELPLRFDYDLAQAAGPLVTPAERGSLPARLAHPLLLRREFDLPAGQWNATTSGRLFLASQAGSLEAWLNGVPLELHQDEKQKKKGEFESTVPRSQLVPRGNVLAVRVGLPLAAGQLALSVRLDAVPHVQTSLPGLEAVEVKLVTEKAVVCDLCSGLPGREPACVSCCPHDAAQRVDARFEFPPL